MARAFLKALDRVLDHDEQCLLYDQVMAAVSAAVRREVRSMLANYEWKTPEMRAQAEAARLRGEAEGRAKGEAEGRAKGEAAGRLREARTVLVRLLETRFGVVSTHAVERIERCSDPDALNAAVLRILSASSVDEVLSGV